VIEVAGHLLVEDVVLLLVLEEEQGLLAGPVVVRDDVVERAPAVLGNLAELEPVVGEDMAHALAVAPKADDALAVLVDGDRGEVHCGGVKKKNGERAVNFTIALQTKTCSSKGQELELELEQDVEQELWEFRLGS
jgi:hypothetical protein